MALNSSGFPVISYFDVNGLDLKLVVCGDPACNTNTITTVASTGFVGHYTSLALNSSDIPFISYYDVTNKDLKLAVCNDATCTAPLLTTVDGAGSDVGQYTSLALDPISGFPVISYFDLTAANRNLKLAVCNNVTCSAHTLTTVDSVGTVGQYTSLALDPSSGFPVISYYDLTNTNLKLAVCNNATCTAPTLTAVDGTGTDVGQYNSLAISSISGFPVISYFDNGNANLKLAVCNNATCTAPTLATLDGIGTDAGRYTSLALNTSGFPVVSYWAFTGNNLQVAVCNDATCTNPTFTIADGVLNDVGQYPSMKLDGAGNPVISYLESSNFLFLASIPATAATIDVYGGATAVAPPGA